MDEKALLEWKEAHANVYSKFKQDFEEQLLKPYHQNILDLGDGNAESLQSVIANLYTVSSKDGFDIEKLYTKAVQSGEVSAYCLCCYLQFDNGADRLADALADKAESQVREMLGIPEIKEIWESIQQNKENFLKQIDKWIKDGVAAIRNYADGKDNDFQAEQGNAVAWGIIAKAFEYGLDPTDKKQRKMAAAYLLEKVSWTGIASDFKISLTASRTQQLCDAMTVSKDLMANLLLAAGGRGGISSGGGGSNSELTNWDGTKKNTGWGIKVVSFHSQPHWCFANVV